MYNVDCLLNKYQFIINLIVTLFMYCNAIYL